jgi:hypothetical protein
MYKIVTVCGLAIALLSFNACKNDKKTDEDDNEPAPGMVRLDVSLKKMINGKLTTTGLPITIDVPDTTKRIYGIEMLPTGELHVFVGKGFNLTINVTDETMDRKKKDIAGDDVDKFQNWVVQDSNALLYKTQMAQEEFHFYTIIRKGGHTYYVKEQRQGADGSVFYYSQPETQQMLNAAKTIMPLADNKQS